MCPQGLARQFRRLARDKGLARGGGLAGIRRQIGVTDHKSQLFNSDSQRIGGDLRQHGGRALADIHRPIPKGDDPRPVQRQAHGGRVRHRGVANAIPHAADTDTTARLTRRCVERCCIRQHIPPPRAQAFQAFRQAGTRRQHMACSSGIAHTDGVAMAKLQAVQPGLLRQRVEQGLLRDGGLRHAETAKGPRRGFIGVDGTRAVSDMGHMIGPRGMDRHAPCHSRSP